MCACVMGGGAQVKNLELLRHTHGAEVARATELSLEPTEQQHLLQLVPEPVQELPHRRLGLPRRWQKVIEVQNPR